MKGVLDVVLTLPLVLPPTVVGWLLLMLLGPKRPLGAWVLEIFGVKLVMTWWSAIFATVVVAFPLMYRTARGAFESFDRNLADAGRTLGRSNTWVFWRVQMPVCKQGILAGTVLAFARALGEYGATSMIAGYTPRPHRHHLHHRLSALAHQRQPGRSPMGAGECGHLRRVFAGGESAGDPPAVREGRRTLMALSVDIRKNAGRLSTGGPV